MSTVQPTIGIQQDPTWQCLASMAVINPDPTQVGRMHETAAKVSDWSGFADRAETHGIAPLASQHVRDHNIAVDKLTRRSLNALVIRHRDADQILNQALVEVLRTSQSHDLQALVLKGSALANMIYPQSGLRPRRDIDILAGPGQASLLQDHLAQSGYDVPTSHSARAMRFHHHLPVASRIVNNMTVSIEVHTDALSGDYPDHLNMTTCADRPQAFSIDGTPAFAFGHRDMLHHLCCHALEPGEPMRLMAMTDIIGYAQHFSHQIDWYALRRTHPHVFNALQHLHYVRPLPDSLNALHPDPAIPAPSGVGENMLTMKQILQQPISYKAKLKALLFPPTWWMQAYYGAAPSTVPGRLRVFRHWPRLARWTTRRLVAQSLSGVR